MIDRRSTRIFHKWKMRGFRVIGAGPWIADEYVCTTEGSACYRKKCPNPCSSQQNTSCIFCRRYFICILVFSVQQDQVFLLLFLCGCWSCGSFYDRLRMWWCRCDTAHRYSRAAIFSLPAAACLFSAFRQSSHVLLSSLLGADLHMYIIPFWPGKRNKTPTIFSLFHNFVETVKLFHQKHAHSVKAV